MITIEEETQTKPIDIIIKQLRYNVETQREVIRLREEGYTNLEIGKDVGITSKEANAITHNTLYNVEQDLQRLQDNQRRIARKYKRN